MGGVQLDGGSVAGDGPLDGVGVVGVGDGGEEGDDAGALAEAVEGEFAGGELDAAELVDEVEHCARDVEEGLVDGGAWGLGWGREWEEIVEVGSIDGWVQR